MIQFANAGKRFGPKVLFEQLDWLIAPRDKVGLVGANGTGKSTLLKVIGGMESLDMGDLNMQKGIAIGYLPQDGLRMTGRTVFEECMSAFDGIKDMEKEMEELLHALSDLDPKSDEYARVSDRFGELDSRFHAADGYALESKVGTVLDGLAFPKEDWTRQTEEFSGGWQMRIALAKLLLAQPNILLLDEPTNHLDLEARNWLEEYLKDYPFSYVLISHDRYFLDQTIERVAEIWNKRVTVYPGNYTKYLKLKDERLDVMRAAQRNQQERIAELEAFISRFRAQATKASLVQSRIKELEKIERIELPPEEKTIHFSFPQPKASGRVVMEAKGLAKSYGEKKVFREARFVIERGDRIALVGHNGAGKSTLIRLLSQTEAPTAGELTVGHNVDIDYFAQDQYKALDGDARIFDDLRSQARGKTDTELRSLLGCFLFSDDDAFKRIGVLSGGERNRYALARMLLAPSNFLLLDEPTNHLDMRAKDVLLQALKEFNGTLVFVSHDRYFIDEVATRVFEIGNGIVDVFPGNYEDYLWRKQRQVEEIAAAAPVASTPAPVAAPAPVEKKRLNPQAMKKLTDRAAFLEKRIAEFEAEIAALEAAMANFVNAEETQRQATALEAARAELGKHEAEWADIQDSIVAAS